MILEEETHEKFGYYPSDLKPSSHKPIICACDDCGKIRLLRSKQYFKLCASCAHKGEKHPFFGKHHSEAAREKMSERQKGEKHHYFGKHLSEIHKQRISEAEKGKKLTERTRKKMHEAAIIRLKKPGEKDKMRKIGRHQSGKKTNPERIFEKICQRNNLDFHYVGDGSLWIGKKKEKQLNPDFIEANGKKILVEIFGDYWHSPLLRPNMKEYSTLGYRRKHYKQYNWIPLFFWESDLKREDAEQFVLNQLEKEGIKT